MGRLIDEDDLMRLLDEEDRGGFIGMPTEMLKKRLDALLDMPYEDCIACKHRNVEWNEKPCSDCWQGLQGGYEPCEDAVSREAVIDALCDNCETVDSSCAHYPCKRYLAIKQLSFVTPKLNLVNKIDGLLEEYRKSQPSVTPKQKTGKWIKIGEEAGALGITYAEVRCSNCGWSHSLIIPSNFCPNCGVKMEE